MKLKEIKNKLVSQEYDFLRTNEHLGNNIILLTVGGSHAYGTQHENSDLDIRGCFLNNKYEILTNHRYEQFDNTETDTVIYSFDKFLSLLTNCNPNVIESLGNKPEHYFYLSDIGKELLDNKHLFLSKKCIQTFGGYANDQLRRLSNISNRYVGQKENEKHILDSINNSRYSFPERYLTMPGDAIRLYLDNAIQEDFEQEIFMDINLSHYPLRDYAGMISEMQSIIRSYGKIGKRNKRAIEHDKIGKHMLHLIRLFLMCFDILEKEEINTYRTNDIEFLLSVKNGLFLDSNMQPTKEFYEYINSLEQRLQYAAKYTNLPEVPNYKEINDFKASVNERIILGGI